MIYAARPLPSRFPLTRAVETVQAQGSRPVNRRDLILDAAISLFHERGYHATGVDDIGEAVSVSGPAIYRHFSSKEDILITALHTAADRIQTATELAREAGGPPDSIAEKYIRAYARVAIDESALISVWQSEVRHLTSSRRAPVAKRIRAWRNEWASAVAEMRPDLSPDQAVFLVSAAHGLISSAAVTRLDDDPQRLEDAVTSMALAVLRAPLPAR